MILYWYPILKSGCDIPKVRWDKRRAACGRAPSALPSLTFSSHNLDVSGTAVGPAHVCKKAAGEKSGEQTEETSALSDPIAPSR